MSRTFRAALLLLSLVAAGACATSAAEEGRAPAQHHEHRHPHEHGPPTTVSGEPAALGWREARVEDLVVRWRPVPDPIPLNELFDVEVLLAHAEGGAVERVDQIRVDANMPDHGHGMTRMALVTREGAERARATGLLFHMAGDWEVTVDLYRDQRWLRAAWDETLD